MILVTGAMGRIGTAAVAALHARGVPTRALVPSRCRVPWLAAYDIEYLEGDYDDGRKLEQALTGISAVILIARPTADQVECQQRVIDACAARGIGRVVKLSIAGAADETALTAAQTTAARWHWRTEQYLLRTATEPCIARTGRTMQDLLFQVPLILAHHMVVGCQGTGVTADADARDVGAVLAGLATTAVPPKDPVLVTGPVALSRAEMTAQLSQALGLALRYVPCTSLELEQMLLAAGISRWQVEDLVSYETSARDGRWSSVTDAVLQWTGRPARSLNAFANELGMSLRYEHGIGTPDPLVGTTGGARPTPTALADPPLPPR